MLTESLTIPLEGEQALLFQGLDQEEERIRAQLTPIIEKRNAMVSVLLAGKGLLQAVQETPNVRLSVTPAGGLVVTVPPPPDIAPDG